MVEISGDVGKGGGGDLGRRTGIAETDSSYVSAISWGHFCDSLYLAQ